MKERTWLPGWTVERRAFDPAHTAKTESIYAQGNGYINARCAEDERYVGQTRGTFATLTFNKALPDEVTELPNLPDVTAIDLTVNGERFSLDRGTYRDYLSRFDIRTGEVERSCVWTSPAGDAVRIRSRRVVSLAQKHVVAATLEIEALSGPVRLMVESGIDARMTNSGSQHLHDGEKRLIDGRILRMATRTSESRVPIAIHCEHSFSADPARALPVMQRRRFVMRYIFDLEPGVPLSMDKISCYHTGRDRSFASAERLGGIKDSARVLQVGDACITSVSSMGYEGLFEASRAAWERYWAHADVEIESDDPFDQLGMRFALYHLNIMIDRGEPRAGIGAKGMTGEGYKGHSFWDTEIFLLPYYALTDPAAARALLVYRYLSLPGAYAKAQENAYEGAMFPWESAWLDDGETTPLFGAADIVTGESIPILTGVLEHHITADIAWGVYLYHAVTGDEEFMDRYGCELMVECARFWASRVEWKPEARRYEITNVIGPDEYKEHVDNNAFTNYLAAFTLTHAADIIDAMPKRWPDACEQLSRRYNLHELAAKFRERAGGMYLPGPREDGLVPQNDQYLDLAEVDLSKYRSEAGVSSIFEDYGWEEANKVMVSKQADLVMLLRVMPDLFEPEVAKRNFVFYEGRCLHDSSLSHGQHGILAAWFGLEDMALDMYRHAVRVDFGENPTSSDEGIHSASMGNVWQCAACGFAGLMWEHGELSFANHLPGTWKRLAFEMSWQGSRLRVAVEPDAMTVEHLSGAPVSFTIDGRAFSVSHEEPQARCVCGAGDAA